MRVAEWLLLALSVEKPPSHTVEHGHEAPIDSPLALVCREFPNFLDEIAGKRVLDYGCGTGQQAVALAQQRDCIVVGIDTNIKTLQGAINLAGSRKIPPAKLQFTDRITDEMHGSFDVVLSQNSMEHFPDPVSVLDDMKHLLKRSGRLYITFGPPWYAPYGSHMQFFCKLPWLNILFSERTVMSVRSRFRQDGATRYEEVESGLNKMSITKFENLVSSMGLDVLFRNYRCVKGLDFMSQFPLLRELFINHVSVILAMRNVP
jgi:SAM-dependent methyltransferase